MSWQPTSDDDGRVHYWRKAGPATLVAWPGTWAVEAADESACHLLATGSAEGLVDAMERADEWAADRWPVQREDEQP